MQCDRLKTDEGMKFVERWANPLSTELHILANPDYWYQSKTPMRADTGRRGHDDEEESR